MGATWHARPRGRATRAAQRLRGALYILYSYITYSIMGFQLSVDRKGIQPLNPSGVINPTGFHNFSRVGLMHTLLTLQVTWLDEERWSAIGGRRSGGHANHRI